ncbi:hypothetical protein TSUD_134520 [Trifolium subterraneum]|uniref:Interferon-related developmental regulator N-terminal domain-containing protein n=1 Tax=Trifolium subterraneum TaxID=3900 RepID=A0A2Z6PB68_TRISU|nr:hypothetical protein TSUD_134520 [Trifolium subterraneum]
MLNDMDYRVRLSFARGIGVLFQTWDGHEELFQDLCLNFGVPLVVYSKGKTTNAKEVLAAGPQPQPIMETVLITLMHVALHSEKVELEAVFMICVVSAVDPCQRELVCAVLDNLSKELQYMTRMKGVVVAKFVIRGGKRDGGRHSDVSVRNHLVWLRESSLLLEELSFGQ